MRQYCRSFNPLTGIRSFLTDDFDAAGYLFELIQVSIPSRGFVPF